MPPRSSPASKSQPRSRRAAVGGRWLAHLNDEQREAVATIEGPLLVLAGAGSGKTRVITHRVAHMLDQGIAAASILAVTFTNKAAAEMRERLAAMVGAGAARAVTLSTFHSLGLHFLKEEAKRKKRGGRFVIFDTGDQIACLRELCSRLDFGRRFDFGAILSRISTFKNDFIAPENVPESDDEYDEAARLLYPRYLEQMQAYAAVDFDDLIIKPAQMMMASKACRARWREHYRYILVDEYQDTNGAQLAMLKQLASDTPSNLCVVGDDDQAIYGWRGAEVRHILGFEEAFPGAKVIYLEKNYRSVPAVLDLANHVIGHNNARHEKKLVATRSPGPQQCVRMLVAPDGDAEATWVAQTIARAVRKGRYQPGDIAVLYRSNILSRGVEMALREEGVNYRVLGGAMFFDRKEVKDVAAYLKLINNTADELSLRRVINMPSRGIGPRTLQKLADWAEAQDKTLYTALRHAPEILGDSDRALEPIAGFVELVRESGARMRKGRAFAEAATALVDTLGLRAELERTSSSPSQLDRRWGNVRAFIKGLETYCQRAERPTLGEYLTRMALAGADEDVSQSAGDLVTLSTLHGSKGLEFPLVILIGLEEGILPHDRTLNPQATDHVSTEIDEERRLLYVGITRAKDELVLTRSAERLMRGRMQPRPPSRFLEGIPETLLSEDDLSAPPSMSDVKQMMAELRARFAGAEAQSADH
ncbi:MAG: UvrD-helicase domain-containing protein [Myxococcales bacterium]|nr:UvrD-helicase domain-containing protein [Myxococcales bacterium]